MATDWEVIVTLLKVILEFCATDSNSPLTGGEIRRALCERKSLGHIKIFKACL